MNRCDRYREMISASLDHELSPAEVESLASHIGECRECAEFLGSLNDQREYFAERTDVKMPSEVETAILAKTVELTENISLVRRLFSGSMSIPKPVAWATAAVILILAVWSAIRPIAVQNAPAGSMTQSPDERVQRVVITDKDIVRTQTISKSDNL